MKIHIHIRGDGVLCAHTTLENDEKLVETIRDLHEDYENADCVLEGFTEGNIVITSTDEEDDNVLYCEYRDANDFVEFDETAGLSEGEIDVRISRREQGVWFEDDIDIGDEPFDIERLRLEGSQIPGFAAEFFGSAEKGPRAATFKEAWSAFWRSMGFRLAGRATRSEYWKGVLLLLASWVALIALFSIFASIFRRPAALTGSFIMGLYCLALLVLFCLPGTSGSNKYGQCPYTK